MSDYSYIGSGKVYLREIGGSGGLVQVGNCSALNFAITEETKELKDYTQGGGGTYNEVRRISAVEMSLTMHDLSATNLARVLYGAATAVTSATVTDEPHNDIIVGSLVTTDHLASAITAVKRGATTLTLGTDYEVVGAGIIPLTAAPNSLANGDDLLITYTKAAADVVEALVNSGKEYEMVFDGMNEARSGKATVVRVHRAKVGAAQNIALIGEDYAALEVSGKLLKDTTKNGTSVSQYFNVKIEA